MNIQIVVNENERGTLSANLEVWDSGRILFVDFYDNIMPFVNYLETLKDTDEIELLQVGILDTEESKNEEHRKKLVDKIEKSVQSVYGDMANRIK